MSIETITAAVEIATMSANGYRGNGDSGRPAGFNVYLGGTGMVLMGLPKEWAAKAVRLLNVATSDAAQRAELRRIRLALTA